MDALRDSAEGIRRSVAAPGEDPIDQRVHRAKPVLDLLMEVEDRFDVSVPLNVLPDVRTVGEFASALQKLMHNVS